ncbi:MAG: carbohydrate kinase family protein [Halobacteriota archaeon]|nr:carbohydrate kinase family protein [Halobacteriota archaeon]
MDVIGYGALNLDKIMSVDKIPKADEEGFVISQEYHPGGSAANTIVGLARLGLRTGYIGKVGSDEEGRVLLEDMKREGVGHKNIKVCDGNSGTALCFVDGKGDRAMLITPGVNDTISMDDIDLEYATSCKFLHLSSFINKSSDISFQTQKRLIWETKAKISFDPGQLYAEKGTKELKEILERTEVIFPSEHEVTLLTGCDYKKGSEILISEGVKIVAVTRGSKGCYVTDGTDEYDIPAEKVDVVDTTGAGDAFDAGFLFGLIKGKDIKDCAALGNRVAACCIQKIGTRAGLPTEEMINLT